MHENLLQGTLERVTLLAEQLQKENATMLAFGEFMFITGFECGKSHNITTNYYGDKFEKAIADAIDSWKQHIKTDSEIT